MQKALIIEDHPDIAEALEMILKFELGFDSVIVDNLEEAEQLARNGNWLLAIVDGNLISGVATGDDGRLLSNIIASREIPVIGYSATGSYQPDAFWVKHGAFLKKPASAQKIKAVVRQVLGLEAV